MAAVTAAAAVAAGLSGCSSDGGGGSRSGASTTPGASSSPSTAPATAAPDPGQSPPQTPAQPPGGTGGTGPAPGTSAPAPAPSPSPPAAEMTLVAVTRSGGLAGKNSTLIIKSDGSFLRLDAKAAVIGRDKLSAAALAKLRTALREADFAHLPRISVPDQPVADGFTYAFRHDGHEVAAADTKIPKGLEKVLGALPSFSPN
ncbi:hypothetical protein [Streptomyces sp. ICC1]|uniref:hypothetical protein n=1 Tax=Streptomyces sp. ICC1 TaxID=2099583 RepID=UPI0013A6BE20|nr:hypothetical protein [Streptomyces sp. ICC1]